MVHFQALETHIRERTANEISRDRAFSIYVLEHVFSVSREHAFSHIVDGGNDRGIDIVYIDDDHDAINICSCKTVVKYSKSKSNFPGNEVDKIIAFASDIAFRRHDALSSMNEKLSIVVRRIWNALDTKNYIVKLHLFSNQMTLVPADRNRLSAALHGMGFILEEHGLYELAHGIVRSIRPQFSKQIYPSDACGYQEIQQGVRGAAVKVSLQNTIEFLMDTETNKIDLRLLEENVRYYLSISNEVNSEIRETILSGRGAEFWFLNNGITIVCDEMIGMPNGSHPINLINPQVVNGGQTANVLVDTLASGLIPHQEGSVNVKIIETEDRDLIRRICVASNTQSRILNRDLRANDSTQIMLASAFADRGYHYTRKRGEVPPNDGRIAIDSQRVGQIILAYVQAEPVTCKTQSNQIFGDLYDYIFCTAMLDVDIIDTGIRLYDEVLRIRSLEERRLMTLERSNLQETWIIEGYFHVLFVVGELARADRVALSDFDRISKYIDTAFDLISKYVQLHPRVSYYRLFRSAASKNDLISLISRQNGPSHSNPIQEDLFAENSVLTTGR